MTPRHKVQFPGSPWVRWIWKFFIRRTARLEGFIDPILLISRLAQFAQPSQLEMPKELMRAGAIMHARGLINSQAIQHNMDWVWPYWVERQFDPHDESFIPRAFNLTHLNLTHRNWTAVGVPDSTELPLVDPRGLVTPFYDGWSLDCWLINQEGANLVPSRLKSAQQEWVLDGIPQVVTTSESNEMRLVSRVDAVDESNTSVCQIKLTAHMPKEGWLVVSLRPYNPEGISFVHHVALLKDRMGWKVNNHHFVYFDAVPDRAEFSHYWMGDVFSRLPGESVIEEMECAVGMATAAVLFRLKADETRDIQISVPLKKDATTKPMPSKAATLTKWSSQLNTSCHLQVPDKRFQFLYDAAVRSLILHSPDDVYPGPYTYKRFWFRDAAFILNAMLTVGLTDRAEKVIDRFHLRQTPLGYFLSQEGEWDSNGQALWILDRFVQMTGRPPKPEWRDMIHQGAKWIQSKRIRDKRSAHYGLLPVGFSAEHLGPNDYYYWDDFWSVAGLKAAHRLALAYGDTTQAFRYQDQAGDLHNCIEKSLRATTPYTKGNLMSASPYRRMDAGAIGSIVAGYPLQLFDAKDARLINTAEYLYRECFLDGAFYHEIAHSGINPYLTLHVAQIFLRAGDKRFFDCMNALADLATPTGQWPEAIHPRTKGGCMGDGQHIWAAAEWVMMMVHLFVREETAEGKLIIGAGIPAAWRSDKAPLTIGPVTTSFGKVSVRVSGKEKAVCTGEWFAGKKPIVEVCEGVPVT